MKKKKKKLPKTEAVIRTLREGAKKTDPQGSYTGHPIDGEAQPVQDADDL